TLELGLACHDLGDMERAERAFRRCVEMQPGSARAWAMRGGVLPWLGLLAEGDACLLRAAQLDPHHHAVPCRVGEDEFHAMATAEWADIPAAYQEALGDTD